MAKLLCGGLRGRLKGYCFWDWKRNLGWDYVDADISLGTLRLYPSKVDMDRFSSDPYRELRW